MYYMYYLFVGEVKKADEVEGESGIRLFLLATKAGDDVLE